MNLGTWTFGVGGLDDAVDLRGGLDDYARGSRNLMPDGVKQSRPWKGLTYAAKGARRQFQIKNSWGGLDDVGANRASGSLISTIADMLAYIGQGQVSVEGEDIPGAIASAVLKFLLKWNGSYTDPKSGPYAAGLPEPAAVAIGTLDSSGIFGGTTTTGTAAVKYARLRQTTGGRSRASASSVVLTVAGKPVFALIPTAIAGQTHHIFFAIDPKTGLGNFYRVARANPFTQSEYTEDDVERTISSLTIVSGDILQSSSAQFTAGDIGKRVQQISGFTVPAPTVVSEVLSTTQVRLSNAMTATTGSVSAKLIAYAAGIDRSVVLNLKSADLVDEIAWIYDFPPATGSHVFQLGTRMFVCGYADTADGASSASADNAGTVLLPSISDYFESYDPRYPTYLPEQVVDILSDGMESYKFIGGRNGIYAAQFLNVTNSSPLTLSILLRGEGITTPENWCARERAIYLFTAKGRPVRIIEGGVVDKTFASKVVHLMRGWIPEETVVSGHPEGGGVVYSWRNESVFFDEATGRWSTELSLSDFAPGVVISSVAMQSQLLLTMENAATGDRLAYWFDKGNGSYVAGVGHYQNSPLPQKTKVIEQLTAEAVADRTDKNLWLAIHANNLPTHVKDGAITAGGNIFSSPTSNFNSELVGSYVLIRGAGASGAFLYARIRDVLSATHLLLGTPVEDLGKSVSRQAQTTVSNAYALIAMRIYPGVARRTGTIEIDSQAMFLNGLESYAASIVLETNGTSAQPLKVSVDGFVNEEEGWTQPSAGFNQLI